MRRLLLPLLSLFVTSASGPAASPTVSGDLAVLQGDLAAAPANAPVAVKNAIRAVNTIIRKPYRWGGGHSTFFDIGYDCSGTVSFMLHYAGVLDAPASSKSLLTWGQPGPGRWITVDARSGHAFAVVGGLRLDTTGRKEGEGPRWRAESRDLSRFTARHPPRL